MNCRVHATGMGVELGRAVLVTTPDVPVGTAVVATAVLVRVAVIVDPTVAVRVAVMVAVIVRVAVGGVGQPPPVRV